MDNFTENGHPEPAPRLIRKKSFFDKDRTWLNILLFAVTLASTFFVGISWSLSYLYADALSGSDNLNLTPQLLLDSHLIGLSIIYGLALISILLAHEMGHYLMCRYYRIDATLPFFIPAPTLIGTMGAFIKIRSPITRKNQLFDVGIAGPLAGFALALPAVIFGLSLSKVIPPLPQEGSIVFGEPLIFKWLGGLFFQSAPPGYDLVVHPIAFAGWVGVLVTALNLFPVGQLDGGHILYAVFGKKSSKLAPWILAAFIAMGIFFWIGWLVWALMIRFIGLRHPVLLDEHIPLSSKRRILSILVIVIFIISFIPDPVQGYNLFDLLKDVQLLNP